MNARRWSDIRLRADKCLKTWQPKPMKEVTNFEKAWHWWTGDKREVKAKASKCKPWSAEWERAALCVHSHEGSWTDPDPTYYGGMQMDYSFMSTYGPEFLRAQGTADHWTPYEQLLASWRAWKVRGWTPWPNTARMCGLL